MKDFLLKWKIYVFACPPQEAGEEMNACLKFHLILKIRISVKNLVVALMPKERKLTGCGMPASILSRSNNSEMKNPIAGKIQPGRPD
jgi:hypothetical protein